MMRRLLVLLMLAGVAACTEKLTAPGDCPAFCPGGGVQIRDTVLTADLGGDSSFTGFQNRIEVLSLLLSDGGQYGDTRPVIRFARRGDSVFVRDSLRPFTLDSVALSVVLERRDTTVTGLVLEFYRLPLTIDTLTPFATIVAAMTPATFLEAIPISDATRVGELRVVLGPAALARIGFSASDSSRLAVGLKLRSNGGGAARIGALNSGSLTPLFTTYVTAQIADTALRRQTILRAPDLNFSARPDAGPPPPDFLSVGGFPAARSFIRFTLPPFLRDSATILRATLELTQGVALVGIPGDTARIDVRPLLADFGAKSPVASDRFVTVPLVASADTVRVDIVGLVQLWQGATPLPSALRLSLVQESATFLAPRFRSTRSSSPPRLRITYRMPFAFEGF